MDKIFDIISKWSNVQQGFFAFICLCLIVGVIKLSFDSLVILFRGYPPCNCRNKTKEDN